jgi:very-short-patch-repair endonuclease
LEDEMDRYRWAERRDGLITTEVLRRDGRSKGSTARDVEAGRLRVVRRGVMVVNGAPPTWRQAVRAVLLSAADDVAASHDTAARLLGADIRWRDATDEQSIHVIAPMGRQVTMPGVVSHRSGLLEPGDVVVCDGMRCTSGLRTVIDLSGTWPDDRLGKLIDDLLRRRLLSLDELRSRVSRIRPAPGRSVARLRRMLVARIPGYDPGESALEARIARIIDRLGLPRATQQHRIELGGRRYRLDFAWPELKVFLEGNGFGFHALATELDRDARRQNLAVAQGWRPIEVTWRMSDAEIGEVLHAVLGTSRL